MILTRKELKLRLNNIQKDKTEYIKYKRPDSVFPIIERNIVGVCEGCKKVLTDSYHNQYYYRALRNKVQLMSDMGYDVKFEMFCEKCMEEKQEISLKQEILAIFGVKKKICYRGMCLFSFKFSDEKKYHKCISDDINDYNAVLALMSNKPTWFGLLEESYILRDELERIKRMMGISGF